MTVDACRAANLRFLHDHAFISAVMYHWVACKDTFLSSWSADLIKCPTKRMPTSASYTFGYNKVKWELRFCSVTITGKKDSLIILRHFSIWCAFQHIYCVICPNQHLKKVMNYQSSFFPFSLYFTFLYRGVLFTAYQFSLPLQCHISLLLSLLFLRSYAGNSSITIFAGKQQMWEHSERNPCHDL